MAIGCAADLLIQPSVSTVFGGRSLGGGSRSGHSTGQIRSVRESLCCIWRETLVDAPPSPLYELWLLQRREDGTAVFVSFKALFESFLNRKALLYGDNCEVLSTQWLPFYRSTETISLALNCCCDGMNTHHHHTCWSDTCRNAVKEGVRSFEQSC